jgi:hypothetical protein
MPYKKVWYENTKNLLGNDVDDELQNWIWAIAIWRC